MGSEGITPASSFRLADMEVFINGIGNISPQETFDNNLFLEDIVQHEGNFLQCVEPEYNDILTPGKLPRRLSRSVKIGVAAAAIALKDAGINSPDAIITGTGMGMLADTEKFLTTMIQNKERFLNPTAFIQSTHNTIGAYIAVMLDCNKYNLTYVHGGLSFENALLNAWIMLREKQDYNILIGGIDEITEQHFEIKKVNHIFKKEPIDHLKLIESKSPGVLPGEGSIFFILNRKKRKHSYARFNGMETYYRPENGSAIEKKIADFLARKGLTIDEIDLVILGLDGDHDSNTIYRGLQNGLFYNNPHAYYKHLCGAYPTSITFAVWLAANIIKRKTIPEIIRLDKHDPSTNPRNILIYNQERNVNHTVMLISDIR